MADFVRELLRRVEARLSTYLLVIWACAYLVLGQGLAFTIPFTNARQLPVASLFTIALVAAVWWKERPDLEQLERRWVWAPAVHLLVGILVILAGVALGASWHFLAAVTQPIAAGAWLLAGWLVARNYRAPESVVLSALRWTALAQLLGGIGQLGERLMGVRGPMWYWGRHLERLYDAPILTRASGFYLNPNTYSLLGLLLAVWAMYAPGNRNTRFGVGMLGVGIIVLGASRTSLVVGAVLLVAWLAGSSRRLRSIVSSRRRVAWLFGALAVLLIVLLTTQIGGILVERVTSLVDVARSGPSADRNLDARVTGWVESIAYLRTHPLGTLVPPYSVLRVVDSDYLRCLAQGSVPYLLTFIAVLASSFWMGRGATRRRLVLWVTVAVALTGVFQASAESVPAMPLFWMLIGMFALKASGDSSVSEASKAAPADG